MSPDRRPPSPTVYSERRHSEAGVTSVMLTVCATSGSVILVGGDATGARAALVPELLAMANLVLRNPADAAAIEIDGCLTIQVHGSPLGVAIDDDGAVTMAATNRLTIASAARGRVRYLAVAGGIEPYGTRGTGQPVDVGAHLRPGGRRGLLVGGPGRIDLREDDVIGVRPGADAARFAAGSFESLLAGKWAKTPSGEGGERVALKLSARGASIAPAAGAGAPVSRG